MMAPTAGYPAPAGYPPTAGYPTAGGYPAPAAVQPGMAIASPIGQYAFRLTEHVPGGPADAEQARRFFLESQFDQVWAVYTAAAQQGGPKPVVLLLDHSDERGRRLGGLTRPAFGQPGFGPTLMRACQGPLGASYAEAAAFPTWKACEVLVAEGLHYLYEPTARETSPDQFMVLVVSVYSVSGFRIGVVPAGY
jgi:hypothetical protein